MWYYRRLADGLTILQTRPEHAAALEELQRVCFPTLADEERFKAAHYRKHVELFPDGQFVALDGDRSVGATTTVRLHFDFDHIDAGGGRAASSGALWMLGPWPTIRSSCA